MPPPRLVLHLVLCRNRQDRVNVAWSSPAAPIPCQAAFELHGLHAWAAFAHWAVLFDGGGDVSGQKHQRRLSKRWWHCAEVFLEGRGRARVHELHAGSIIREALVTGLPCSHWRTARVLSWTTTRHINRFDPGEKKLPLRESHMIWAVVLQLQLPPQTSSFSHLFSTQLAGRHRKAVLVGSGKI
jgi:hypothetical protein